MVIVLPAEDPPEAPAAASYKTAAEELQKHLKLITGVEPPVVRGEPSGEGR